MVQVPTNYKMGTGLAATIYGQQAGLEAEQQGLANLTKAMQMPQEALKGQEAAMLMQNPEYLQQKTANTLIELKNTYSAQDFQQTLDAANRVRIKLDAAGGDPAKEQQIVQESLAAMQIDPNSEFAQYAAKDPRGAITKFIQGVEVGLTGTGGAKQLGAEKLQELKGTQQEKLQAMQDKAAMQRTQVTAGATAQYRDQAQLAGMLKDATNNVNNIQNNLAKMESAEGKNALVNQFMASGVPQAEAEAAVNSPEFKQQLQSQLTQARAEQDYLKKQSPYFKGFNFGAPAPASAGGSSGLPPGVTLVK